MKIEKKVFALFFLLVNLSCCLATFKKICYFTNWAQSRPSGAEFYPEDIDPELCTHIIYAFAKIENYTIAPTEAIDIEIDDGFGLYERIMVLKIINPALKILLAVGGWAQGSAGFDTVVENDETMKTFAKNSIIFLRKWEFDGLDVDWEFPVVKKKQFTRLLEILRIEFENENPKNKTLELSIAVSGGQATIDTSYEVDKISQYVDFVNLMAYDFHGSWSIKTGFHSALYSKTGDLSWENTLNVDWSVNYWLKKGCPSEKLILGIAFYGRGFKLANSQSNKVGSPSRGSSRAGKFTQEAGFLSFYEICQIKKEKNLAEEFDNELGVPGLTFDNQWIGYENQESVILKASYIKDMCLGGAMIWTIDFDDFKGTFCDEGTYPLMKILNEVLKDSECYESINIQEIASSAEPVTTLAPVRVPVTEETLTSETIQFKTTTQFVKTEPSTKESVTNDLSENSLDFEPLSSYKCNGTTLIPSFIGCEFYQVCLKGFENPAAILKCPVNLWFDKNQQTCTENKPVTCETEIESTTLIPMISPDTSLLAYATQSVTALPNTTEHFKTQDNDLTTQIAFATLAPFLSTDNQQNDINDSAKNTTALAYVTSEQKSTAIDQENEDNTLANTTVMAYVTSEQKSTAIDQKNEDNTLANTTVMAYVTSEQKSTSIDQENEDNTLANTTVMAYATSEQKSTPIDQENEDFFVANTTVIAYVTSETRTKNSQSDDGLPETSIIAYASPQSTRSTNEAILNTTVIVYVTPDTTKSTESGETIYSETTVFAYASPGKTQEFKTSESSFLSTVTQSSTLKTTKIENDGSKFRCPHASGLYQNQESCDRFWHCSNFIPFDKKCPGNLVFDNKLKVCAWTSDSCKQTLKKLLSYDLMRLDSPYFKLTLPVHNEVFVCPEANGLFENRKNCKSFWQCYRGVPYLKMCAGDLVFNKKIGVCDYHSNCNDNRFEH